MSFVALATSCLLAEDSRLTVSSPLPQVWQTPYYEIIIMIKTGACVLAITECTALSESP